MGWFCVKKCLIMLFVLVFVLAGCMVAEVPEDEMTTEYATTQEPRTPEMIWCDACDEMCALAVHRLDSPSTAPMHFAYDPTDEFLATFESVHTFTHEPNRYTPTLVLWTDAPVLNLSFISLGWHRNRPGFYENDSLFTLEELLPGEALVLEVRISHGGPWEGIAFVDETGAQRHMTIGKSWAGGCIPFIGLHPFENNPPPNNN